MMLRLGCASLSVALFMPLAALPADAQSERRAYERKVQAERRAAAERRAERRAVQPERKSRETAAQAKPLVTEGPLLSLVSLNDQRMYVYDANGFVTQTRISSGRTGHETPTGIYSILEKKVYHESNIYLGAKMPHMQRLTMTGIALHGGVIPGYPASGGCVRLPFEFARRFFNMTSINQRVVIAPDVQSPVEIEHPLLFSALPSSALSSGASAGDGIDVKDALLGISPAHAATEPPGRTRESIAEARRSERQRLLDSVTEAAERRSAAAESEKAAVEALKQARAASKTASTEARDLQRAAQRAVAARKAQEGKLNAIAKRIPKDPSKLRADKLQELRDQEAAERARIAPVTEAAERAAEAAKAAADAAQAAEAAVAEAQAAIKSAKAEIKDAATAEAAAKRAVAAFDRQEGNLELPVSVFISSKTGMIAVRQGFEQVLEVQATIDNPDVPLDTFVFTALDWKDDTKTALRWSATEVNEHSRRFSGGDDTRSGQKKRAAQSAGLPPESDTDKATRTLDRITIPRQAAERIAEVVKPGSTLIISSYDTAKSEMRYAGTDFIVQMPEVVAKITRPTPRPRPVETVESGGGFFFFNSAPPPPRDRRRQRRVGGSKSTFW